MPLAAEGYVQQGTLRCRDYRTNGRTSQARRRGSDGRTRVRRRCAPEPLSDPGDLPPGSTVVPRLVIRFDGFCQLRELVSPAGPDEYWDDEIHSATTRRLRPDEVEALITEAVGERDLEDALVRRLLDSTMCETVIRMVTGHQVRLLRSTPVRVLVVSASGKLLPLPHVAAGST